MASKEAAERQQAHHARHPERRRLDLDDESQHTNGEQNGSDERVRQEPHQAFSPVLPGPDDLGVLDPEARQHVIEVRHLDPIAHPLRLTRGEGQQLPFLDHARDGDRLVHHGLADARIDAAPLGQRPELRAHDALRLLGHLGTLGVHHRRRTQGRVAHHEDAVRRDADQGPR